MNIVFIKSVVFSRNNVNCNGGNIIVDDKLVNRKIEIPVWIFDIGVYFYLRGRSVMELTHTTAEYMLWSWIL